MAYGNKISPLNLMTPRTKRRLAIACGWVVCAFFLHSTSTDDNFGGSSDDEQRLYRLRSNDIMSVRTRRRIQATLTSVESPTEMADARGRHHDDPTERNIFVHENSSPPISTPGNTTQEPTPSSSPMMDPDTSGGTPPPTAFIPTSSPSVPIGSTPTVGPTNTTISPTVEQNETFEPTLVGQEVTDAPTIITGSNETITPTLMGSNETLTPTIGGGGDETSAPTIVSNETMSPSATNDTMGPASPLGEFLTVVLTDDGSLATVGTPQFDALAALEETNPDLDPADEDDQIEIVQRYSLNTIFFATSGTAWVNNEMWTSASHPCGDGTESPWFGVQCDADLVVIEFLSLPTNDMIGSLPSEIRGLSGLQSLNIFENQLSGAIPNEIGELTMLTVLEAGSNFFESTIPASIGNLSSLDILNLYSNLLSGNIPTEIGQLQALRSLSLNTNFLNGPLPVQLFALSSIGRW
jgi:hypothetical protein